MGMKSERLPVRNDGRLGCDKSTESIMGSLG